jgi:hypothetical protein
MKMRDILTEYDLPKNGSRTPAQPSAAEIAADDAAADAELAAHIAAVQNVVSDSISSGNYVDVPRGTSKEEILKKVFGRNAQSSN